MWVFFVTGVSGAGKSTLARRMAEWAHRAVSTDADRQLCAWTDLDGRRVDRPAEPAAAWLSAHEWRWDPARLDQIITAAARDGDDALWLFGNAANALDVADRFDATLLLEIDQQAMIARMGNPARGNDFGRVGDSLSAALASYTPVRRRVAPTRREDHRCHRRPGRGRAGAAHGRRGGGPGPEPATRLTGSSPVHRRPDCRRRPGSCGHPLWAAKTSPRAYRSIMTAQEELAAAIDGRAGWWLEQAAAIYAPAGATAQVLVLVMVEATRLHRFAAAIVREGRAEHSRTCSSAVEEIRWSEGVRLN